MNNENIKNKIVNVCGVKFDISSILNDVTTSIQNNIQKSLDGALKDYELYKSTHDAILQIPFVRDLYIQNQELISQLELLEQLQSQSQPIQLKINELSSLSSPMSSPMSSPVSSPVVMHPHFQIDSHYGCQINCENKKLHSDTEYEEKSISNMSESSEEEEAEAEEEEEEEAEEEAEEEGEGMEVQVIAKANLGYCELFHFKCAGNRTCDAWLAGGPIK